MRLALLISLATAGLASNVWGSVFGLLMMAVTRTYLPPSCWITLAYSFSAPMAVMLAVPPFWPAAVAEEQAVASRAASSAPAAGRTARTPEGVRMPMYSRSTGCRSQVQVNTVMVIVFINGVQVVRAR